MPSADRPERVHEIQARYAVVRLDAHYRLLSTRNLEEGDEILRFAGRIVDLPSRWSIQIGLDQHINLPDATTLEDRLDRYPWCFLNHSCAANSRIEGRTLVATRSIAPWEQITFDYEGSEFEMASPFQCSCHAAGCRGRIRGYRWLSEADRAALSEIAAPHVLELARTQPRSDD